MGAFPANDAGLYDMVGNVWEWMDNAYLSEAKSYPRWPDAKPLETDEDWEKCDRLSLRGGSWFLPPEHASCSYRIRLRPVSWGYDLGFRVVLSLAKNEN